jgi:mediator of RNA polymerase II transcription subunit 17
MPPPDDASLDGALKAAQQEIVEQEIFSLLVKEAGSLPTASARVSERLIVIDAAQAIELKFELVRSFFII